MASESERKYDEISRRLGVVQEVTILLLTIVKEVMACVVSLWRCL